MGSGAQTPPYLSSYHVGLATIVVLLSRRVSQLRACIFKLVFEVGETTAAVLLLPPAVCFVTGEYRYPADATYFHIPSLCFFRLVCKINTSS